MALLFFSDNDDTEQWRAELEALKPDLDFRQPSDSTTENDQISYALVNPMHCPDLRNYPNLKAIFSLYAGVDALLDRTTTLPENVPIIRLISSDLSLSMSHYMVQHCLNHLRHQREYFQQSAQCLWQPLAIEANRLKVGIMGLGQLGLAAGEKLAALEFDVAGWSRSEKHSSCVTCYHGVDQLSAFLSRSHILISLLPLTSTTTDIFNKQLLKQLPKGACFINAGRGRQVVEADLIECLDSGQLSSAVLDVFREEPLPANHPFWLHPKITVTPHTASESRPCRESAQWIVDNINAIDAGGTALSGVIDFNRGY